ncbi:MAG: T9SS type A sorting domain-containing protein [Bacteroidota bacterium]
MNAIKYFIAQCIIIWIVFPIHANSQTIQNGSWSNASGDVKFYVSQHSQIDTLSVRITHTSGSCSGSLTKYYYGISIIDRSFSKDLGSVWDGSTGSISGDFSQDGNSCSGSYSYTEPPCSPVSVSWTATVTDPDTTEEVLVEIDDLNFLNALIEQGVDTNGDEAISYSEAEAVVSLDVSDREISDMKGIEAFVNLDTLNCLSNQITSLDLSGNQKLEVLWCRDNQIGTLDISNNPALELISCRNNKLVNLDVSNISALRILYCSNNQLGGLDISNNIQLSGLYCEDNLITSLDVSNNPDLWRLWCSNNQLTSLDVSHNGYLEDLWCGVNQLASLDVSKNLYLVELWCEENLLTSLDVSKNSLITNLVCYEDQLTNLDVSNNHALRELWCGDNLLSNLDVSNSPDLEVLSCYRNKLLNLDVSNNPALMNLHCGSNQIGSLDISANQSIGTAETEYDALDISYMPSLNEVCVWTMPFPPAGVTVDTISSPNVFFTTECSEANNIHEIRQSALSIYPNPFRDILTIRTDNFEELSITVTSPNGQIVESRNFAGNLLRIDLSSIERGVYFITIRSKNFVTTRKIIKM